MENTKGGSDLNPEGPTLIRSLFSGSQWNSSTVTFAFESAGVTTYSGDFSGGSSTTSGWTEEEKQRIRDIFEEISGFLNISFEEKAKVTDSNIDFQKVLEVPGGWAGYSHYPFEGNSYIVIGEQYLAPMSNTTVHEIGHALGLEHPFEGYKLPGVVDSDSPGDFGLNNEFYTTIAYNTAKIFQENLFYSGVRKDNFMAIDIAALQSIYGANQNFNSSDTSYSVPSELKAIWDTGGEDVIDFSAANHSSTIDLRAASLQNEFGGGGFASFARVGTKSVNGAYSIAYGVQIENAVGGSGGDQIYGNDIGNELVGNDGDDNIYGADGDDTISGGFGSDQLNGDDGDDNLVGNEGSDTISGGHGDDVLKGGEGDDQLDGGDGDNTLSGGVGNDTLILGVGNNTAIGGLGDDTFKGGSGSSSIIGGFGFDTVLYELSKAELKFTRSSASVIRIDKSDGSDTIDGVEKVAFSDGAVIYDLLTQKGISAYKLYGGAFNRTPDEKGLRFWATDWLESGNTLKAAAELFVRSAEFKGKYGYNLTDEKFVDQLYLNILEREGEPDGRDFWVDALNNGSTDRASVLVNFTQLEEYSSLVANQIEAGMFVT